jgi:hypothetical protein
VCMICQVSVLSACDCISRGVLLSILILFGTPSSPSLHRSKCIRLVKAYVNKPKISRVHSCGFVGVSVIYATVLLISLNITMSYAGCLRSS